MTDAIGYKHLVVAVDVVVQSELGIEEVVAVVYDVAPVQVVAEAHGGVLQPVAHMAILQIGKGGQSADEVESHLAIDVEVRLTGVVVIVFVVGT